MTAPITGELLIINLTEGWTIRGHANEGDIALENHEDPELHLYGPLRSYMIPIRRQRVEFFLDGDVTFTKQDGKEFPIWTPTP